MWSLLFFSLLCISCNGGGTAADLDRLASEVQAMRRCQRKADNLNFYLHKYNAEKLLGKFDGKGSSLPEKEQHSLLLARGRYSIIYSDYLLQTGNKTEAIKVIDDLSHDRLLNLNADTLLWLNYLSHQGQVHYYPYNLTKHRADIEKGYDCLMQCYIFASRNKIDTYKAVSMQLLSQYLLNDSIFQIASQSDPASIRYINEDSVADTLLAGNLAERALNIFLNQKDYFHTASAWKSLANCYFNIGDAEQSIACLDNALANPAIDSMPDLKAGISEQMSMSYAALDDKHMSDYYRNQYLDLQDSTRQDRQLEARVISLERITHRVWTLVAIASAVFLLLCLLTITLVRLRHRKERKGGNSDELETLDEEIAALRLRHADAVRSLVEQRARVTIIKGMLSLIERMKLAVHRHDYAYVHDVAADIERQNDMLTGWIKMSKGNIKPRIEEFPIADVLSIVGQSASPLAAQGITLTVNPSDAIVKADKILTLFIINTLVDNARKAIPNGGGKITVNTGITSDNPAHTPALRVEVTDTGRGMTEEQVHNSFSLAPEAEPQSGGFGLQNCRGIIESYRKLSSIFSVCHIEALSELGKGTTVRFTLPAIIKAIILIITMNIMPCHLTGVQAETAAGHQPPTVTMQVDDATASEIERLADSLYNCNIQGRYETASQYADTCLMLTHGDTDLPPGLQSTCLSIYNETAVTALALHQWQRYKYFNHLYGRLYKQSTRDDTLLRYCQDMERGRHLANLSMLIVLLLTASLLPLLWFVYFRPLLRMRRHGRRARRLRQEQLLRLQREHSALHVRNNILSNQLSSIKHETMYYPPRIKQLLASPTDNGVQIQDTVNYYSVLCSSLSSHAIQDEAAQALFPVSPVELTEGIRVTANPHLARYLMHLLRKHNSGTAPLAAVTAGETRQPTGRAESTTLAKQDGYVTISFTMPQSSITPANVATIFTSDTPHTDYLIMRQIVRETADATHRYASGIMAHFVAGTPRIIVTLPDGNSSQFTVHSS